MTSNDLVPHHEQTPTLRVAFLPSKAETARIWGIATTLSETSFVPRALRGDVPAIMAAMLTGRELGILPMRALRQVSIIEGKPTPSPELMMAIALKAGHDVYVAETSRERCVVEVRRGDWPDDRVARLTWDLEDAVAAGLCTIDQETGRPRARSREGKPLPWERYTRAMLRSRAVSEACRTWLPDVVEGASYAPEELGAHVTEDGHDQDLVDAAEERGESYDPLEGESDEVREAVAEAMGGEGDVLVDPDTGEEIVDAELVDDDPDLEGEIKVSDDAGEARFETPDPTEVDLSEIPDPTVEEVAYAAWLAALDAVYRDLNVTEVSSLIRKGYLDLDNGRRLVIPDGAAGLALVARLEDAAPGAFRRTVKATLEGAGWTPEAHVPGAATPGPREAPAPTAEAETPEDAPEPETAPDGLEERRDLLRRWKSYHRELGSLEGNDAADAARRCLASRLEAGAQEDRSWSTVDLEVLRDLVAQVETERAQALPF